MLAWSDPTLGSASCPRSENGCAGFGASHRASDVTSTPDSQQSELAAHRYGDGMGRCVERSSIPKAKPTQASKHAAQSGTPITRIESTADSPLPAGRAKNQQNGSNGPEQTRAALGTGRPTAGRGEVCATVLRALRRQVTSPHRPYGAGRMPRERKVEAA